MTTELYFADLAETDHRKRSRMSRQEREVEKSLDELISQATAEIAALFESDKGTIAACPKTK